MTAKEALGIASSTDAYLQVIAKTQSKAFNGGTSASFPNLSDKIIEMLYDDGYKINRNFNSDDVSWAEAEGGAEEDV